MSSENYSTLWPTNDDEETGDLTLSEDIWRAGRGSDGAADRPPDRAMTVTEPRPVTACPPAPGRELDWDWDWDGAILRGRVRSGPA